MRIEQTPRLDFDDVLIRPKRSSLESRADVDLLRSFKLPHSDYILSCVPIIAANMDTVGTIEAMKALCIPHACMTALHKHHSHEEIKKEYENNLLGRLSTFFTFGICEVAHIRIVLHHAGITPENWIAFPPRICLDVANGYQERFIDFVKEVRTAFPTAIIMAGNVVTADMVEALIIAGADIVKVGIGPGQQCETRKVTGVGYPQLSAIIECADAAHGLKGLICADGGCKTSGDVAKAFAAGADLVMLGTMLAGHKENISIGEFDKLTYLGHVTDEALNQPNNFKVKTYGMSSKEAMDKHNGGVAEYRSSEGKTSEIDYRGTIHNTMNQILGGLRSTCTYVGATSLKELHKRATFIVKK